MIALRRFREAVGTPESAVHRTGIDLDAYRVSNEIAWPIGPPRRIAFDARDALAQLLAETPRAADPQRSPRRDVWVCIRATVDDPVDLRRWLRGFGDEVRLPRGG